MAPAAAALAAPAATVKREYFRVPPDEKDRAVELGACWDADKQLWCVFPVVGSVVNFVTVYTRVYDALGYLREAVEEGRCSKQYVQKESIVVKRYAIGVGHLPVGTTVINPPVSAYSLPCNLKHICLAMQLRADRGR